MARLSWLVCVGVLVACAGCKHGDTHAVQAPAQPAVVPAPATPLDVKKAELGGTTWDPQWDGVVEKAVPADLLSAQAARAVRMYCPRFAEATEAEKREFWAYTFQAIAAAEAGLNPTADVHHLQAPVNVVDPVTKRPARQEGLMQVKYEDAQRYGCDFDWEKDRTLPVKDPGRTILSPENNLGCGVKIMENQIVTQGKPLVSRTSYWATLQPGTAGFRVFAKQMANVPAACGLRERSVPRRRTEIASQ
jgi:Transglycosylase SLT domain